jgi:hypothetical protein
VKRGFLVWGNNMKCRCVKTMLRKISASNIYGVGYHCLEPETISWILKKELFLLKIRSVKVAYRIEGIDTLCNVQADGYVLGMHIMNNISPIVNWQIYFLEFCINFAGVYGAVFQNILPGCLSTLKYRRMFTRVSRLLVLISWFILDCV